MKLFDIFDWRGEKIAEGHTAAPEGLGPYGVFLLFVGLFFLLGGGVLAWVGFFREYYRAYWLPVLGTMAVMAAVSYTLARSRASLPSLFLTPILAGGAVLGLFASVMGEGFAAGLILGLWLSMFPAGLCGLLFRFVLKLPPRPLPEEAEPPEK